MLTVHAMVQINMKCTVQPWIWSDNVIKFNYRGVGVDITGWTEVVEVVGIPSTLLLIVGK